MFFLKGGWPSKPQFQAIHASIVHHTVVFLLLVHHCGGQSVIGPSQPVVAFLGDDVMLPCHLEPAVDASGMTVEWARADLSPRFVHVWRDGVELETKKHPYYEGRTLLSINKLKHGDISLKLYKVKLTDEGTYRCFIPTPNRESSAKLVVGAVSSLIVSIRTERLKTENDEDISRLVLQCESKGWYPEPEVSWLDGEGHVLSAGPTETVRGPDGLYTVSSRVTVEKRHNNNFTCRVQQKDINQTRETQIHVPDDIFSAPCSYTAHITIMSLTLVFMVILGVVFFVWKWRQKPKRNNFTSGDNTELHPLKEEQRETLQVNDLNEKAANLDLQLEKVEEECKDVEVVLNFLTDNKTAVEKQMLDLVLQRVDRQRHEVQSQPEGNNVKYPKGKQNDKCPDTKINLDTGENEIEKKIQDTDIILKAIFCGVSIVKERKTVLDYLKQQLLEMKEQRDGIQKDLNPDQTDTDTVKKFSTAAEMKTG